LAIIQMMQQSDGQYDVEGSRLGDRIVADPLALELSLVAVLRPRSLDVSLVHVHTQVLTTGQEGHHSSRAASDVENAITRTGMNVVAHQDLGEVFGADQGFMQFVKKRPIENRADAFDHAISTNHRAGTF